MSERNAKLENIIPAERTAFLVLSRTTRTDVMFYLTGIAGGFPFPCQKSSMLDSFIYFRHSLRRFIEKSIIFVTKDNRAERVPAKQKKV